MRKKLSIVVSVYNEEQALPLFYETIKPILEDLSWEYELLFVNDGSQDGSLKFLQELTLHESRVKLVSFSRNFGHEAAMIAGIDYACGDAIVCMDADLQHPPACLPEIVEKLEEGCGVVTMVRTRNESAGIMKNITSAGFYWLINTLSDVKFEANASDFFAISRQAADVLRENYREKVRFLRGYVQNVGFLRATIAYEAKERAAGESKYSIRKLFTFSINTILCFSNLPLKLGIYAGGLAAIMGIAVMLYTLCTRQGAPSGYATIVILNCFMFAVLFLIVGIIGEYIAILFNELKDRPIYIVEKTRNLEGTKESDILHQIDNIDSSANKRL
ncbi:MAG: glycosyltransferase family 2 protein [Lachnospiraceae bacterium]|nr:glycosyltransferase family 2 protein [Lachnospiraceae bacterium]MCI9282749.1 glycosyltransferase family 2 protein [Lachnospiraceae bacterium]